MEKIFLEKIKNLKNFARAANAEDLAPELLEELLRKGIKQALAKRTDAENRDDVIDFYIVQSIRSYQADLPGSYALKIKI